MHVSTLHAEVHQQALLEAMPKAEYCIETLLSTSASSIFGALLLAIFMRCMLPDVDFWRYQMPFRGVYVCSKTVRRLILKWIYVYHGQMDFLFHGKTSHPAQWMASVLNVHPCISQAILPLSCWGSKATIKCRQPNSGLCSLICNLVYEDKFGKRCKR